MNLQSVHDDFVKELQPIYEASEAENIFALASEKVVKSNLHRNHYAAINLSIAQFQQFENIKDRLLKHEPIQYIINECWFYDIPFYVDENVLIPRPETEELVDWVIKENRSKTGLKILDVGTGSGCIPVILKRKLPTATVHSCDVSESALQTAKKNAETYQTEINFSLLNFLDEGNWSDLPSFDLIVSNPPYIPTYEKNAMQKNVLEHEPHLALFVENEKPLTFYEAIAKFGSEKLNPDGCIYVEIHESLGKEVVNLFARKGFTAELKNDLQGKNRMVKAAKRS